MITTDAASCSNNAERQQEEEPLDSTTSTNSSEQPNNEETEDEEDEEDNEEYDNSMPSLQERDREDSDSESERDDDEAEDEDEDDEGYILQMPHLIRKREVESDDDDSDDDDDEVPPRRQNRPTLNNNEDTPTTLGNSGNKEVGNEKEAEEDLYFTPSDEEYEDDERSTTTDKSAAKQDDGVTLNNNTDRGESSSTRQEPTTTATQHQQQYHKRQPENATRLPMKAANLPFGHICDDTITDNDTPYVRVYCQNVNGIFDRDGIGLDSAFREVKQAGADIFTFNETHGDDSNATARRALRLSKHRMWGSDSHDCKIIHSSSTAPVLTFTKPGGNLVGVTGSLVGRIRETITDPYGRWCGFSLLGRDNREILILTAYNVTQAANAKVGDDTLFNQQIALYKLKNIRDPDPRKIFIKDLTEVVKKARREGKDIILTGDFNELVGDDSNAMVRVLTAGDLTDAHGHQHGEVDIKTYTRGHKRLDYVFVTPRMVDHILRSGYEAFHARIASDHRGYYVDFALAGFLDRQLPAIFSATSRAIRGTHPSNITKYVKQLHKYLETNDIFRLVKMQKHYYERKELEKLDVRITRGMLAAENKCRIHHRQTWSPEVNEVMTTANILRIQLSSLRNGIDCNKQIEQKQRLLKKRILLSMEIDAVSAALHAAQTKCRKLIKEQRTKQTPADAEQEEAFVAMNPEMGPKRAAQIFQRARDTKQMMSELPSKMNCPGGLSSILVPLPTEGIELEYMPITDGPTIEEVILRRNVRHFRQAETTPLATAEVINTIGWGADTECSENLLEGQGDPSDITDDEWSRYLLASMKRHSQEITIEITSEKMMAKYKRWKERTSTSPSGRHLGHFHALFKPFKAENEEERDKLEGMRIDIIEMHAAMLQTAYDNEHVYDRWSYILTCMLGKDSGVPRIHRLRIIHLYECDLNLLLGMFFREFDQHCEDNDLMNKGIYGCRPNRRAMDPVFVDVTQTELSMVLRAILVKFNNDATACFDRILVHILTLCLRSYGMPKKLTIILGKLLESAKYAIKTGIGISKATYQHSDESPAFGSGQGSGASAQGWGKMASKAFDAHDKFGYGCLYTDPWKTLEVMLHMLGYVDDNNITNNGADGESVEDVVKRTQHDAQLWNDLLRATGGALNLDKCFAQVIHYTFAANGGPVVAPADPAIKIVIKDRLHNKDVIIKPISPYQTYSFLGTKQGISQQQKQQHKALTKRSQALVRKLACSAMSPRCAWVHYTAVFLSSIGYPLSMCHMSSPQLHELQKKYIPALLNKISIIRTHDHSLVFGSRSYGGIGCQDLRIEQGISSVENLIRQMRTPGYGKDIATVFLRWFQHASGISLPLLQYPKGRAPHLEGYYYANMRRFLAKINGSIELTCVPLPTDERSGDEYIMDVICSPSKMTALQNEHLKHYTNMEIRKLYWCKSYLQVKRISDLCTADGTFILPNVHKGQRSIRQSSSRLSEIKQERPNEATWGLWRKFLQTVCTDSVDPMYDTCTSGKDEAKAMGSRLRLRIPLGDWLIQANDSERLWPFYYSNSNNVLYRSYRKEWHTQGVFSFDCHQGADSETFAFAQYDNIHRLPEDAIPVDVFAATDGWRISFYQALDLGEETQNTTPTSFLSALMQQPVHISQYYTQIDFHTVPVQIYEQLKTTGTIYIATDGGAIPFKGSLGFVLADKEGNILLTCYGQPAGHDPLSFRAEICAFLAAVRLISLLTEYYDAILPCTDKSKGKFQFYTDSLSMIKKLKAFSEYPTAHLKTVLHSEWDVLSALHRALQWFPIYPEINWVKSHQDDRVYDEKAMPLDAYLNSEADELATIGLKRLQEKPRVPMDPLTEIQFHLKGRTITRDFKQSVRELLSIPKLRQYYLGKYGWRDTVFDSVDWDIFRPVYKKYITKNGIQWMHKFCCGKLPTGKRVQERDQFHDKRCASCLEPVEDDDHIITCKKRKAHRRNILNQIKTLRKVVDPYLCDILQEGIAAYFKGECMTNTMFRIRGRRDIKNKPCMERYHLLIDEQLLIGWDNLLRGKFTKQWKIYQRAYVTRVRLKHPRVHAAKTLNRKRDNDKDKGKRKNKTEPFHSFFQAIIPSIQEIWKDRCIDRNTPVKGGRIAAEYHSLIMQVTHLYTLREMVLPEDETKIYNETLKIRLEATNQQLKKWINRWRSVIDHSMKRVKELAQSKSIPIWRHYTADKPAKTTVSRHISTRKHDLPKKMLNNPLTNVFSRAKPKRSTSKAPIPILKQKYKVDNILTRMFTTLGKKRSTSRVHPVLDVEDQSIEDRFGDVPT